MPVIHFVVHRGARQPLCGEAEAPHWIETRLPGSVTCHTCARLLAGARTDRAADGDDAAVHAPAGD